MVTVTSPLQERLKDTHGYIPFIRTLQATYNLQTLSPENLKWASINERSSTIGSPPLIQIAVAQDHPLLAVRIYPTIDGKVITGSDSYHAPLLLKDVQRWGLISKELGQYKVDRLSGVPEQKTMLTEPIPLADIVKNVKLDIKDTTAVVEAVALIPVATNGDLVTEFTPIISFDTSGHRHYQIMVVAEDRLNIYAQLSGGSSRIVKDIQENQALYNWRADAVPNLSDVERLLLPSQHGQMILIATPYEDPMKKFYQDYGQGVEDRSRDRFDDFTRGGPMKGGDSVLYSATLGPTRSARVSDARISTGSRTGTGSLYEGELAQASRGNSVIFHLRVLTVDHVQAETMTVGTLNTLGDTLSRYVKK